MAFSKQTHYKEESQITSGFAKALGFAGRIEILIKLEEEGPLRVQAIAKGHPICMETLSGHLKILREAHLVIAEERYPYTFYRVHEKNMIKAKEMLLRFFSYFGKESA
jgi:DNA-binding transcriptional ArsR family regulator